MPLTKAAARTAIAEAIDDAGFKRWSQANLDILIARVFDDLWSELLEQSPWLTSQLHVFTASQIIAPGYLDLRLTTNGGQLTQRFFRVQRLIRDSREYESIQELQTKWRIVVEADIEVSAPRFAYQVLGNQLWIHPLALDSGVELRYAFLPVPYTSLTEGYEVPWAEGYDSAYIYEAAARALVKGDAESMAQYKQLATEAFDRLKAACSRQQVGAQRMQMDNDGTFWGSI
ncbi:MAG: hypothetical protein L0Z53_06785 [Acidobacteriales bacterium]|nr:hypothetical protein [Terriglobales bacterium]